MQPAVTIKLLYQQERGKNRPQNVVAERSKPVKEKPTGPEIHQVNQSTAKVSRPTITLMEDSATQARTAAEFAHSQASQILEQTDPEPAELPQKPLDVTIQTDHEAEPDDPVIRSVQDVDPVMDLLAVSRPEADMLQHLDTDEPLASEQLVERYAADDIIDETSEQLMTFTDEPYGGMNNFDHELNNVPVELESDRERPIAQMDDNYFGPESEEAGANLASASIDEAVELYEVPVDQYNLLDAVDVTELLDQLSTSQAPDEAEMVKLADYRLEQADEPEMMLSSELISLINDLELPAETEEIETALSQIQEIFSGEATVEDQASVEIVNKIAELVQNADASEEEVEQQLSELYIELLQSSNIAYNEAIVKSLVLLTKLTSFDELLKNRPEEISEQDLPEEVGTREFLQKLYRGLKILGIVTSKFLQIGRSALRFYNLPPKELAVATI